jgi:hypothetical protein
LLSVAGLSKAKGLERVVGGCILTLVEFAYVDVEALAGLAIGFGLIVVLPIVGLLLAHQRKMAELVHGAGKSQALESRLQQMQAQIDELRNRSSEQALLIDDYRRTLSQVPAPPSIRKIEV